MALVFLRRRFGQQFYVEATLERGRGMVKRAETTVQRTDREVPRVQRSSLYVPLIALRFRMKLNSGGVCFR